MIRVIADFNRMEGDRAVALNPERVPPNVLVPGTRIIVYEPRPRDEGAGDDDDDQ